VIEYRAYIVGHDGHFISFEPMVCADDAEAKEKAKRLVDGHVIELWSGARLVIRFDANRSLNRQRCLVSTRHNTAGLIYSDRVVHRSRMPEKSSRQAGAGRARYRPPKQELEDAAEAWLLLATKLEVEPAE
jgi:hypothetical protein